MKEKQPKNKNPKSLSLAEIGLIKQECSREGFAPIFIRRKRIGKKEPIIGFRINQRFE